MKIHATKSTLFHNCQQACARTTGHFGVTGIYNALDEYAMKWTFLLLMTCGAEPGGSKTGKRCVPCAVIGVTVLLGCCGLAGAAAWQLLLKPLNRGKLPSLRGLRRGGFARAPDRESERDILMGRLKS